MKKSNDHKDNSPDQNKSKKRGKLLFGMTIVLIFFFFAFDVRLKNVHYEEWFPQYAGGQYQFENGQMIVSRGLDRESTRVPRIFNRPELVIVDIKVKE